MDFMSSMKHRGWLCSCQELAQRPPVEMQTYLVGEGLENLVMFDRFKLRFQSARGRNQLFLERQFQR